MKKIILIPRQSNRTRLQAYFNKAVELLDKELDAGRECDIYLLNGPKLGKGLAELTEYEVLVVGDFDYCCANPKLCEPMRWFNKEILDKLQIKYP